MKKVFNQIYKESNLKLIYEFKRFWKNGFYYKYRCKEV